MEKQKKTKRRKSVISYALLTLIAIFLILVIVFVIVKVRKPIETNNGIENDTNVEESETIASFETVKNTYKVSSFVFNSKNDKDSSGFFSNLTDTKEKQVYASLVLEENRLMGFGDYVLNKFVITIFDTENIETFTGTYTNDNGNLILTFLTSMYSNYTLPSQMRIYVTDDYAILDGNKLLKSENLAKVYTNDTLSSLPSVFGNSTINYASLLLINDNLSDFGVANQNKFIVTGFNENDWDYYVGEAYEDKSSINLKLKNYGFNVLNDIMPSEATFNINNEGLIIDSVQFVN